LRKLKTWLGRVIRDIERQIAGDKTLQDTFRRELWKARWVLEQKPRDGKGRHVYALHAPEVECIGKGKSHKAAVPQPAPCLAAVPWLVQLGNTLVPSLACIAGAVRGEGLRGHHHQALTGWSVRGARHGAARQTP